MEAIAIIGVLTILAALITYGVRTLRNGKKLAKNDPIHIKTGTPVIYKNANHIVLGHSSGKYDLRSTCGNYILVRKVERSSLILA